MKNLLIILIFISTSFLRAEEPFWEYIGGPNGGECTGITYNVLDNIFYFNSHNGIYQSLDKGISWSLYFRYNNAAESFYPDYSVNINGVILGYDYVDRRIYIKQPNKPIEFINTQNIPYYNIKSIYLTDSNEILLVSEIDESKDTFYLIRGREFGKTWDYISYFKSKLVDYRPNNELFIRWPNSLKNYQDGYFFFASVFADYSSNDKELLILLNKNFIPSDTIFCPKGLNSFQINGGRIVASGNDLTAFSSDKGVSWQFTSGKKGIFYQRDSLLYLYSINSDDKNIIKDTIYVSNDFGMKWVPLYHTNRHMSYPVVSKDDEFFGANLSSFYKFDKINEKWMRSDNGIKAIKINDISYSYKSEIYSVSNGVYKSTDNGYTWHYCGLDDQQLLHILVGNNGYVYVTGSIGGSFVGGVFRSTDGGSTWERFIIGLGDDTPVLISDLYENKWGHIFAGSTGSAGYFLSTNHGETWVWEVTPNDEKSSCFSTNSEGHIFRGAYAGIVIRSTDDGDTWEQMSEHFSGDNCFWDITSIAFDPRGENGYALCLKTTDNGRSWKQFNYQDTEPYAPTNFDSLGNYLLPGWRSTNKGQNWEKITTGLEHNRYNILSVSPDGYYFLGAEYGGLYRSKQKYVSVEEKPILTDEITISPNPAHDFIEINVGAQRAVPDAVSVFDNLGLEKLNNSQLSIFNSQLKIDVSALAPGVYFVKIGKVVRKFVKM